MPDKFAILRLTLKVDMDDIKEKSFARAMLRRLNVLFAKCRPNGALGDILNGNNLSDAYEGKQIVVQQTKKSEKKHVQKASKVYVLKSSEKVKPEAIIEQSMEPPEIVGEFLGD